MRKLFCLDWKFPRPHISLFKYNMPVHSYPTSIRIHSCTQDSYGNIGNRSCVGKMGKRETLWNKWNNSERPREQGCHLEYSIHGKQLGSILLRHRIKKYPERNVSWYMWTWSETMKFLGCACKISLLPRCHLSRHAGLVLLWHLTRLSEQCILRGMKRIGQGKRHETFLSVTWVPEVFLSCVTCGEKLHRSQAEATSGEVTKRTWPNRKPRMERLRHPGCPRIRWRKRECVIFEPHFYVVSY